MNRTASPFRTPQQKEEARTAKRFAVLQAAVEMFNTRGFHATSLDDVAKYLGISKPTIYHYLGNKDNVLLECVKIGLEQLLEAATTARAQPGRGIDRLEAFLERYAQINMDHFGRCVIRTPEETISPDNLPTYRALKRKIDVAMRDLIEEGIEDGSIAPVDPKYLAFALAGALNWPARWHSPDGEYEPAILARKLVKILAAGFRPR